MLSLFPVEPLRPIGFEYFQDFLSPEEESYLIEEISKISLHTFNFLGYEAKRKVASYGYDWNFENKQLSKGKEIPSEFQFLIKKVAEKLLIKTADFGELLVTEYPSGSVINWHRDAPPFDIIVGISLYSNCTFRFRPHDPEKQNRASIISHTVSKRSLYVMKDEARIDWQHSIKAVKEPRFSITLRTLNSEFSRRISTS